jgi:hypothetical protein
MQPVVTSTSLPPPTQPAVAAAQPSAAQSCVSYSDIVKKRISPFWSQVEPRLAAAFDGHPMMLNQIITREFINAHVNAPSIIPGTKTIDGNKYIKHNADTVSLAAQVLCVIALRVGVVVPEIYAQRMAEANWKLLGERSAVAEVVEKVKRLNYFHFDVEVDKVPFMFPLVWGEAPHIREIDQKLVYTVNCSHQGVEVSEMIMDLISGPYFQNGITKYHIDPSNEPAVRADFEKIKMLVRNIVNNVPQCSLYFQDLVHSYRTYHSTSDVLESLGRIPEEDALSAMTGFIFFQEFQLRKGSCLATECLRVKDLSPSDSVASMRENLELCARWHRGLVDGFRVQLEKRNIPCVGFSHIL